MREPEAARKQWIAGQLRPKGEIVIDAGAVTALRRGGNSLLPIGALSVRGDFQRGEVVACHSEAGALIVALR